MTGCPNPRVEPIGGEISRVVEPPQFSKLCVSRLVPFANRRNTVQRMDDGETPSKEMPFPPAFSPELIDPFEGDFISSPTKVVSSARREDTAKQLAVEVNKRIEPTFLRYILSSIVAHGHAASDPLHCECIVHSWGAAKGSESLTRSKAGASVHGVEAHGEDVFDYISRAHDDLTTLEDGRDAIDAIVSPSDSKLNGIYFIVYYLSLVVHKLCSVAVSSYVRIVT